MGKSLIECGSDFWPFTYTVSPVFELRFAVIDTAIHSGFE